VIIIICNILTNTPTLYIGNFVISDITTEAEELLSKMSGLTLPLVNCVCVIFNGS